MKLSVFQSNPGRLKWSFVVSYSHHPSMRPPLLLGPSPRVTSEQLHRPPGGQGQHTSPRGGRATTRLSVSPALTFKTSASYFSQRQHTWACLSLRGGAHHLGQPLLPLNSVLQNRLSFVFNRELFP